MLILLFILVSLALLLLCLPLIIAFINPIVRDYSSPFECGFDPYHPSRVPFSMQFFIIAVIFLIFDIEIVILLPLPLTQIMNFPSIYLIVTTLFIILLLLGTYYEWYMGALSWNM